MLTFLDWFQPLEIFETLENINIELKSKYNRGYEDKIPRKKRISTANTMNPQNKNL